MRSGAQLIRMRSLSTVTLTSALNSSGLQPEEFSFVKLYYIELHLLRCFRKRDKGEWTS